MLEEDRQIEQIQQSHCGENLLNPLNLLTDSLS